MCQYLLALIWLLPVMLASNIHFKDCPQERPFDSYPICPVPDLYVRSREVEPWLTRIDPGEVGDVKILNLTEGRINRRITLAVQPALFELPGFLSDDECEHIVSEAKSTGLSPSTIIGDDYEATEGMAIDNMMRVSESAALSIRYDNFFNMIKARIAKVAQLPRDVVLYNEPVQVARYLPLGHYHAHMDSSDEEMFDGNTSQPCCYQAIEYVPGECHVCRYATFMIYLNDVEEGGETAFPFAHAVPDEERNVNFTNLSTNCYRAKLFVRPKKGTALFWYSHFIDPKTGWLGKTDENSLHGGCDVIRGEKWITTFWLNAPIHYNRNLPSIIDW